MATPPRTVIEPTCGRGAFLVAAQAALPGARLLGRDLDDGYVAEARVALGSGADLAVADFFTTPWSALVEPVPGPLLIVGNLPWVTSAALGALGDRAAPNAPPKRNDERIRGIEARTGRSNFDVSEWMILRLLEAIAGRDATLAMLCKSAVARKVIAVIARRRLAVAPGGVWSVDAREHWDASVDAALLVVHGQGPAAARWPLFDGLAAVAPAGELAVHAGRVALVGPAHDATAALVGVCRPEWRSGMKHDCARVMELTWNEVTAAWSNALGETVSVEDEVLFPLAKGTEIARAARPDHLPSRPPRPLARRAVIVPQRALGEDTEALATAAPRAFSYLSRHRAAFAARKSSIYRGQSAFAVFGMGPYAFAPWKVAISGLHKEASFALLGPREGKPWMLDDTSYFLPFDDEARARAVHAALSSPLARSFFEARVFREDKRPFTKALLQSLDLEALERRLDAP